MRAICLLWISQKPTLVSLTVNCPEKFWKTANTWTNPSIFPQGMRQVNSSKQKIVEVNSKSMLILQKICLTVLQRIYFNLVYVSGRCHDEGLGLIPESLTSLRNEWFSRTAPLAPPAALCAQHSASAERNTNWLSSHGNTASNVLFYYHVGNQLIQLMLTLFVKVETAAPESDYSQESCLNIRLR